MSLSKILGIKKENEITYKLLNEFISNFNKNNLIHIYGGEESGKTTFALKLTELNPDKVFIYIDTYYSVTNINNENVILLRNNNINVIYDFLNKIDKNMCDCVILDAYSNLLNEKDKWNDKTYITMEDNLKKIYSLCVKKNCTLILLNTLNGKDKPFNKNNYLIANTYAEFLLSEYNHINNSILITPIKAINTKSKRIYF